MALRVPAHPVAHALLREAGIPVAAPSANRSTGVSPTTAQHVARSLGERVDVIVDGGPCPVGIESTVLSLAGPVPTLLRPGSISVDDLRPVIGDVALPASATDATAARPSPGMLDRHYAPARHRPHRPARRPRSGCWRMRRRRSIGGTGLARCCWKRRDDPRIAPVLRLPDDPAGYASRLYAALHELDDAGCDVILIDAPPDTPAWAGVRDRLRRAATQ